MPKVKADPRVSGYAVIMLCEYYKGYQSLSLEGGADAFLTCDGDYYQGNATHVWHDETANMDDRWVAMLWRNENGNYTCSTAALCPRMILVDGTLGVVKMPSTGKRLEAYWSTDGSSIQSLTTSATSLNANDAYVFARKTSIGAIRNQATFLNLDGVTIAEIGIVSNVVNSGYCYQSVDTLTRLTYSIMTTQNGGFIASSNGTTPSTLEEIYAPQVTSTRFVFQMIGGRYAAAPNLKRLILPKLQSLLCWCGAGGGATPTKFSGTSWASLIHIEVGQGFYSDFDIKTCTFTNCILTDANDLVEDLTQHPTWSNLDQFLFNFEHLIVDKLADLTGQTAKTITLAAAPYAAITSEIRAKMSAKNWNLASA